MTKRDANRFIALSETRLKQQACQIGSHAPPMPPTQRALPAQARAARNARPSPTELGGGQSADGASARKRSLSLTRDGDARSDGTRVCSVRAVVDATLSELRGRQLRASKGREWQRPLPIKLYTTTTTVSAYMYTFLVVGPHPSRGPGVPTPGPFAHIPHTRSTKTRNWARPRNCRAVGHRLSIVRNRRR